MIICLTGAQGTGKTTLVRAILPEINKLARSKNQKPFFPIVDSTRKALEVFEDAFTTPVNEATIVGYRLYEMAHAGDNIVMDRGLWDPIAYASIYHSLDDQTLYLLNQMVYYILKKIPHQIFYLPIAIDLVDDGARPTDPKLQTQIDLEIKAWLNQVKIPYCAIESISIDERVAEMMSHLKTAL